MLGHEASINKFQRTEIQRRFSDTVQVSTMSTTKFNNKRRRQLEGPHIHEILKIHF